MNIGIDRKLCSLTDVNDEHAVLEEIAALLNSLRGVFDGEEVDELAHALQSASTRSRTVPTTNWSWRARCTISPAARWSKGPTVSRTTSSRGSGSLRVSGSGSVGWPARTSRPSAFSWPPIRRTPRGFRRNRLRHCDTREEPGSTRPTSLTRGGRTPSGCDVTTTAPRCPVRRPCPSTRSSRWRGAWEPRDDRREPAQALPRAGPRRGPARGPVRGGSGARRAGARGALRRLPGDGATGAARAAGGGAGGAPRTGHRGRPPEDGAAPLSRLLHRGALSQGREPGRILVRWEEIDAHSKLAEILQIGVGDR